MLVPSHSFQPCYPLFVTRRLLTYHCTYVAFWIVAVLYTFAPILCLATPIIDAYFPESPFETMQSIEFSGVRLVLGYKASASQLSTMHARTGNSYYQTPMSFMRETLKMSNMVLSLIKPIWTSEFGYRLSIRLSQ